jgi:hypothetical protein
MLLLNCFLPYIDSWHGALNSDIKHPMYCRGVHDVAMHDVAVHDLALHDGVKHDVAMHSGGMYCVSMHDMDVPGGKIPIFGAQFRKKRQFFPIICH